MKLEKQPCSRTIIFDSTQNYSKLKEYCKEKGIKIGWVFSRLLEIYLKDKTIIKE